MVDVDVFSLLINNQGHIFAGTESEGLYRSVDNGESWIPLKIGLPPGVDSVVWSLASNSHGHIFAAVSGLVFHSEDNGDNWQNLSGGLEVGFFCPGGQCRKRCLLEAHLEAACFRLRDGDTGWQALGLSGIGVSSLAIYYQQD